MRVRDTAERMVGFRTWRVVDGRLWSPYIPCSWDERVMRAQCYRGDGALIEVAAAPDHAPDAAPHPDCECGIYAYDLPPSRFSAVDHRGVTGIVSAWGRREAHTGGVRAEMASVEALAVSPQFSDRQRWAVQEVAERLDVDLIDHGELEAVAGRYGPPLRPELLEPPDARRSSFVGRGVAAVLRRMVRPARG
jgi:hypothetical protein